MSSKLIDFYPSITCVNLKNEKLFADVSAVAIPVSASEKPSIAKSAVVNNLTTYTKIDLNIELSNWPEFTAKAGEIIEIPLSVGKLTRIYLVGVGESNQDDIRKASALLSRKVKGTDAKVLSALVEDKKSIEANVIALVLANYQFNMKSEKKTKKSSFAIYGDFKDEVERALVVANATWRTRDL
ncbi:MAG: leucyl aminopeptidase family protein, partial [Actinobacteria bacterium]|nr:leucyl aminopeptidase family protein [Actinomycetota bacterium]